MKTISIIFLIVIFICHNVHAADLFVTSSNEKDLAHNLVPCMLNEDCQDYPNGVCKNNFCECNGTKFCEDKVSTIVTKIGEFCTIDAHCNLDQASCKGDKCTCDDGTIQSLDGRKCLNIAEALGSTCEESIQCYTKVPHSGCQNNSCVCQQQMHEFDGDCFRNVALGNSCHVNGECAATEFSKCINDICTCKDGYVDNKNHDKCLQLPNMFKGPCIEDIQCKSFGKSVCKEGICQCEELYQFKFTKNQCVRDLLLGEKCENHTDCHGPEEGASRSECILGECKCKTEFVEEFGFCASGAIPCAHVPSLLLIIVFIICLLFANHEPVLWISLAYGIFYMLWITFLGRYFTDNNNYMDDKNPKED